jgi:hypothetical protein
MEMEFLFKKSLRRLGMSITMIMLFSSPLLLAQTSTDNTTVLQVKHNQAPALATRLESVLKDFGVSAQVTANRANNTLIVNGSSNVHKIAQIYFERSTSRLQANPLRLPSKVPPRWSAIMCPPICWLRLPRRLRRHLLIKRK